ncbi:1-phosphofructokinase [Novisyntrophococcus fermenticellae]|uniref:1-phosphofructokinase n=1 Tax=Novisyntrophococcus fermenticellae TaxID=2068655 RepID=UPI001E55DCC9|nr:1-phosphofructokinase [Novisyntrophococcus fermenticellae]
MVYTVTFNPSLDYVVAVDDFQLGMTNRTTSEQLYPGGKGINVSVILKHLGVESTALGFTAGFIGEEIRRNAQEIGVNASFIRIDKGNSRINLKLRTIEGTEINGRGPSIPVEKVHELLENLEQLQDGDVLVLAGSIPASIPDSIYRDILKRVAEKEIMTVVDATGDLLVNVLEYHPFLIKPNQHELEEIFQIQITERGEIVHYAKLLQEQGAKNVLVSMGGKGAILVAADGEVYDAAAPKGKLMNGVGAGDSMVAGFLSGWMAEHNYQHAFHMGVAAGSATAFSEYLAERDEVERVYHQIMKEDM